MAYDPTVDFLALSKLKGGVVSFERMPGLDYVMAALVRAGLFSISVGQTPPLQNQTTTVWFRTSSPSWVAEGAVFLWDVIAQAYVPATPTLWIALLSPAKIEYLFQSVTTGAGAVGVGTTILAVQRISPVTTNLTLPNLQAQWSTGRALKIVDWSIITVNHTIVLATPDGSSIMRLPNVSLLSTVDQLAGVTLSPSPELNGWVIAP